MSSVYSEIEKNISDKYPNVSIADIRTACMLNKLTDATVYFNDEVKEYSKRQLFEKIDLLLQNHCIGGEKLSNSILSFNMKFIFNSDTLHHNKELCRNICMLICNYFKDSNVLNEYNTLRGYEPDILNIKYNYIFDNFIDFELKFDKDKAIKYFSSKYPQNLLLYS